MKAERGITLIILSIYVIVFSIIIVLLANLSSYIYKNLDNVSDSTIDISEFNKFNMYFIEDVKTNKQALVQNLADDNNKEFIQIAFADGDIYAYTIGDDCIYKNNQKIASNILDFKAEEFKKDNKLYIEITIKIGTDEETNYKKTIDYVLKYW